MAFATTVERAAFLAVCAALRADPVLVREGVRVWPNPSLSAEQNRQKLPETVYDQFIPNVDDMPMVRVWPSGCRARRESERSFFVEWTLTVACYTAGADYLDAIDLWGAVRDALWPIDADRAAAVRSLLTIAGPRGRLLRGRLSSGAESPALLGTDQYGARAAGTIVLPFDIVAP